MGSSETIAVIGTVGIPACYGGFESLVENLLDSRSSKLAVYCSSPHYKSQKPSHYKGARLHYVPLKANGTQSVPYDVVSIFHSLLRGYSNILMLGVSGAIILPLIKTFFPKVRVVVNLDGIEWRREKWGVLAKWYLKTSEKFAVQFSDVMIADNQAIADYIKEAYDSPSVVIAYGGDHALADSKNIDCEDFALGVCRIEPENNVHLILEAFSKTKHKICFVGNWQNSNYGRELFSKYGSYDNIDLMDPIYDKEVLYLLRARCKFYVHGHSAGGTNPSLVEFMHFAKPILAYDCAFNRATMENKGKYFSNVNELLSIIDLHALPDDHEQIAEIANRRYTWKVIRDQYFSLFN